MPRSQATGSLASSDNDSISLNSTAPSQPRDEYPIEGILAERVIDGITEYLVKWEGYPDERCTWEPGSSFQDEQTFHDWQDRKMRISRGLDLPYDVEVLETRVENWIESTEKRKARRRAKKTRLGLLLDPESEGDNSDYGSREVPEEYDNEADKLFGKRRGSSTSATRGVDRSSDGVRGSSKSELRFNQDRQWTPKEEAALKNGLELVKGPFWEKILGFFGSTGTIGQDLKDKDALDLEAKTLKLKSDYLKSGRDTPQYLRFAGDEINDRTPGKAEDMQGTAEDRDTPSTEDSLMEDLQHSANEQIQQRSRKPSETRSCEGKSKPLKTKPKGLVSNWKGREEDQNPSAIAKPKVSIAQMIPRVEPARKTLFNRTDSQMGSVGRGPLRLRLRDRKLKSAGKKPKVSGAAILGNWSASVRPRRKQLPLQNAASAVDRPPEKFGKLSTKRRYEKASRNERAPNFDSLTLRNPKEFNVVKKPSVLSPATKAPTKTPFQLYQESFGEGEEELTSVETRTSIPLLDVVRSPSNAFDKGEHNFQLADQCSPKTYPVNFPNRGTVASSTPEFPAPFTTGISRPREYVAYNVYDSFQVIGTIKLGLEWIELGSVRFRGLDSISRRLMLGVKSAPRDLFVWFKQQVFVQDYKAYFQTESFEFSGYIAPFPQTEEKIIRVAETLKVHVSGGLFLANEFSMLVYPSGSEDWTFLDDKLPACPSEAVLRFVMRKPFPELMNEEPRKPLLVSAEEELEDGSLGLIEEEPVDIETVRSTISIRHGESNINTVFRIMYGVDYSRLVAPTTLAKGTEMHNFFLIFPPSKEPERDLVVDFLQQNKPSNIFSYETKGAWDYFSTRVDAGVIIIHEDFFDLWRIPNLARTLRKCINVWNFNMTPSPLAPNPHLNRLFPHGAAILLTDGLFLHRPHEAVRILSWFRLIILNSKAPRTWKLYTRPRLNDWLLSLQADRNMEDSKVYVQCYGEVWRMLKDEYMEEEILDEEQATPEAPVCFMGEVSAFDETVGKGVASNAEVDSAAIAHNDEVLLEWFAGYAMTKLEHFRRFDIVTGAPPGDERHQEFKDRYQARWSHIEVTTAEDLYKKHKVQEWETLEREEEKRVRCLRKSWAEEDRAEVENVDWGAKGKRRREEEEE